MGIHRRPMEITCVSVDEQLGHIEVGPGLQARNIAMRGISAAARAVEEAREDARALADSLGIPGPIRRVDSKVPGVGVLFTGMDGVLAHADVRGPITGPDLQPGL